MNIAIIDDFLEDREKTRLCLQIYLAKNYIGITPTIFDYISGEAFLESFKSSTFDIIFIDYFMTGISGLETAQRIRDSDKAAIIIFITTSPDFAVEGYRVKASGYLVKPFQYTDFAQTLNLLDMKKLKEKQYIEISMGKGSIKIFLHDIIYCDVSGHYTQIHTTQMGVLKCRMPFCSITDILNAYNEFVVCYRGCIINMLRIHKIDELNINMDNGERIPFRKKEHGKLLKRYTDFLFEKTRTD